MELAFHHVTNRTSGYSEHDLALLDTETGQRRRLVGDVHWATPRWSVDGRRVGFDQRLPDRRFVWREVDVETGEVTDVDSPAPDVSGLPGDPDYAERSPGGLWIAYRHRSSILCVARADGSQVYALTLGFPYTAAESHWSPCGTKLAAQLTAVEDTGAYVIDLRTGEARRVSPERSTHQNGWTNYFVSGWSPDGDWVVTTKVRWHDPETYDYEWHELWLLSADGSDARRLTDDGLSRHAVIRPAGEVPPPNGEHELTLAWAESLRTTEERRSAGEAIAAQVRLDLEAGPPFTILLMVRTADGVEYPAISGCASIPDGFERLDAFLRDNDYRPADPFTVVFPRYVTDDPEDELASLEVAHLILAETRKRMWEFDRDVPPAPPG